MEAQLLSFSIPAPAVGPVQGPLHTEATVRASLKDALAVLAQEPIGSYVIKTGSVPVLMFRREDLLRFEVLEGLVDPRGLVTPGSKWIVAGKILWSLADPETLRARLARACF